MKKIFSEFVKLDLFKKIIVITFVGLLSVFSCFYLTQYKKKVDLDNYYYSEAVYAYVCVLSAYDTSTWEYSTQLCEELENKMLKDGYTRAEHRKLYVKAVKDYQKKHNLNRAGKPIDK